MIGLVILLLFLIQIVGITHVAKPIMTPTQLSNPQMQTLKSGVTLAFFLKFGNKYFEDNLAILAKNLKTGDYLLVDGSPSTASELLQRVQEIRSLVNPGVNVIAVANYKNISNLTNTVPTLPKGIDYIMYDYEGGSAFSPEFTKDENISISYFDEAKAAVERYNKNTGSEAKLFVTPPFGELQSANWDWGLAANHMDVIDIQLQAFLKDPNLQSYATEIMEQIKKNSPDKLVFVQCSLSPQRGTVQDNVNAIETLRKVREINAFLVFYQNGQGSELTQFFSLLDR